MRAQHLLVASSALLIALGVGGQAFAGNDNKNHDPSTPTTISTADDLAASIQAGKVKNDFAKGTDADNGIDSGSFNGAKGMFNVQQNGGANSLQQSDNTLAAILNTPNTNADLNAAGAIALSSQVASVEDVKSIGAVNTSKSVTKTSNSSFYHSNTNSGAENSTNSGAENSYSTGTHSDSSTYAKSSGSLDPSFSYNGANYGSGSFSSGGGSSKTNTDTGGGSNSQAANWTNSQAANWTNSDADGGSYSQAFYLVATSMAAVSTNAISSSFAGATGMFNVSQNVGNNSMQQVSNTAAAIIGK